MKNKQEEEKKLNHFTPQAVERFNAFESKIKYLKAHTKDISKKISKFKNKIESVFALNNNLSDVIITCFP